MILVVVVVILVVVAVILVVVVVILQANHKFQEFIQNTLNPSTRKQFRANPVLQILTHIGFPSARKQF